MNDVRQRRKYYRDLSSSSLCHVRNPSAISFLKQHDTYRLHGTAEWQKRNESYDLVGRATQIASYFYEVVLKARALLDVLTRRGVLQNNPCHWEALLTLNWHLLMTKSFVMAQWHTLHITSLTLTAVLPHSLMNSVMEYLFVSKLLLSSCPD